AGQRLPSISRLVQGAEQRIETGGLRGAHRLEVQERVGQRQGGVDGIARRTAVAAAKPQRGREQRDEGAEVGGGGRPLQPAQRLDGGGTGGIGQARRCCMYPVASLG